MILVASTLASYKAKFEIETVAWLLRGEEWLKRGDVHFFLALQTYGHGKPKAVCDRMAALGGTVWEYEIDEHTSEITRPLCHNSVCTGRNLAIEFAQRDPAYTHVLHLDSDIECPADMLDRLLEMKYPVCGAHVPAACLDGPRVTMDNEMRIRCGATADIRAHWNTAACLMLERRVFKWVRWAWSIEDGCTDDPWFQRCIERTTGYETWVRHDVLCKHMPEIMVDKFARGADMSIRR